MLTIKVNKSQFLSLLLCGMDFTNPQKRFFQGLQLQLLQTGKANDLLLVNFVDVAVHDPIPDNELGQGIKKNVGEKAPEPYEIMELDLTHFPQSLGLVYNETIHQNNFWSKLQIYNYINQNYEVAGDEEPVSPKPEGKKQKNPFPTLEL